MGFYFRGFHSFIIDPRTINPRSESGGVVSNFAHSQLVVSRGHTLLKNRKGLVNCPYHSCSSGIHYPVALNLRASIQLKNEISEACIAIAEREFYDPAHVHYLTAHVP